MSLPHPPPHCLPCLSCSPKSLTRAQLFLNRRHHAPFAPPSPSSSPSLSMSKRKLQRPSPTSEELSSPAMKEMVVVSSPLGKQATNCSVLYIPSEDEGVWTSGIVVEGARKSAGLKGSSSGGDGSTFSATAAVLGSPFQSAGIAYSLNLGANGWLGSIEGVSGFMAMLPGPTVFVMPSNGGRANSGKIMQVDAPWVLEHMPDRGLVLP